MTTRVRLHHRTTYRFDHPVALAAHEFRLRPAPHCPIPILDYELAVHPHDAHVRWHHDPHDNWVARAVFPRLAERLEIEVRLDAELVPINPFDFYVEPWALHYPFSYPQPMARELTAYLACEAVAPPVASFVSELRQALAGRETVDALAAANRMTYERIRYLTRDEQGVLTPEETLERGCGSCRDSAWLLVQALRHLGIAARFASGYLVQLKREPSAPHDTLALHAWCEAYLPGAGWIGLDATSGLATAEGHIPLASVAHPDNAAPVTGSFMGAGSSLSFQMTVERP
ncbi:MAG TPA: transglutaminase family protein [Usitatibacter sp.]|jgi:transglutaminase-like putative cysteine protease|nr:transglutaminase family protein [Usitatibacter sp.]